MSTTSPDENRRNRFFPIVQKVVIIPALAFGLNVGTGGALTPDYIKERGAKGYEFVNYKPTTPTSDLFWTRSPADDLAQIRNVLHPTVTDLANALRVSRQAVYSWQAGSSIAQENAVRLAELARAADLFAKDGLTVNAQLLRRSIYEGKNLLEIVRDGGSVQAGAQMLIEIVRREARQREILQSRLASRPRLSRDDYDDFGTPMLDERG